MKARIWAIGGVLALIAILVAGWIMGDAQPTRWMEIPVAVPANAPTNAPTVAEQP